MDQSATSTSLNLLPEIQLKAVDSLAWFRGKRFWILFLLILGILGLLVVLEAQTSGLVHILISDIAPALSLLGAFIGAFWVSLRTSKGRNRWAWRCISLAFLSYFIAECIETFLDSAMASTTTIFPSPADPFILSFYPLMTIGLLLLPFPSLSRSARGRILIDAGIFACAVLGLSLLTIITPLLTSRSDTSLLEKILVVAYPLGDVVLVVTLVLLLFRVTESALRPILLWMVLGVGVFVYADSVYNILTLQDLYFAGSPLVDPFTTTGELLMGLSAWFYLIHGSNPGSAWAWLSRASKTLSRVSRFQWTQKYVSPYLPWLLLISFVVTRELLPPSEEDITPLLEGLALAVVFLIITRQILLRNDLVDAQQANERALQLDNLKDQFITSVNHELRTPLMTMQTYIELLRTQQRMLPEKSGRMVEEIGRTNDALVDLVQSILEVRRIDQKNDVFPREAINLQQALERAIPLINPREGRLIEGTLRVNLHPNLTVWGEAVRVQQVLTNLISNAIKYSPPGAAIEISAQMVQVEKGKRPRAKKPQQMVEIRVRDYGLGIPPDQIPLLFRRFVRLPRDLASTVVGSGLGLYLCQTLVEAMDGRIWVESEGIPGQGSTFYIHLPFVEPSLSQQRTGEMVEVQAD